MYRHLEKFLDAIGAAGTALFHPVCQGWRGDPQINGKSGHILSDGRAWYVYFSGTPRRWNKAKRLLPGKITQDGDDEGIIRFEFLPSAAEGLLIRRLLGIRKRGEGGKLTRFRAPDASEMSGR
jgi:hypothetical protein